MGRLQLEVTSPARTGRPVGARSRMTPFVHPTASVEERVDPRRALTALQPRRNRDTHWRTDERRRGRLYRRGSLDRHGLQDRERRSRPRRESNRERVFVGPGAILTNDSHPRAVNPDHSMKTTADWTLKGVVVREGASVGAGAIVMAGIEIGAWALVGAGSVVMRDVEPHSLVQGVPARPVATVCYCGDVIDDECPTCGWRAGVTRARS